MGSKLVARNLPAFDDPPIMSDTVLRNHITIAPHHPSPLMELLAALIWKWSEESNLLISASGGSPPSPTDVSTGATTETGEAIHDFLLSLLQ